MQYLGDYRIDDYITFGAQLHRFSSGAVYAPAAAPAYTFYENNSTSGAPTGGNLAQLNSKIGLYTARVQLTTASGFEAGKEYLIHIEATVDSVAAAELLMFRIIANPKVDVDTIKGQTVTCSAGVTVLASVGTAATATAQTGDSYAIVNNGTYGNSALNTKLGSPAGASIAADLLTIDNLVDDLESRLGTPSNLGSGATVAANLVDIEGQTDDIGAAGAGLTAIPTIAAVTTVANLTNLPAITANWLTAAGINADAFTAAKFAADVTTEFQNGLATAAELAKVPKSDGSASWNATALAAINAEMDAALNTAIPGSPTADSINERIVALDTAVATNLDATISSRLTPAGTLATVTNVTNAPTSGDLTATMKVSINAEVLDVLTTDTFAEPGAVPAATSSIKDKLNWLFALGRNKLTQSSTTMTLRNDADGANIATAAVEDTGTFTRSEWT